MVVENPQLPQPLSEASGLKPRGLLYHYTTVEGFLGILDSGCLRATHIRYLSDSREFIEAIEHAGGLVDALVDEFERINADHALALAAAGDRFRGEFERLCTSLRDGLQEFISSINSPLSGRSGAYVVSFTDDAAQGPDSGGVQGDRLSQWRAYGGSGRGISLGFDFDALHGGVPGESWRVGGCIAYLLNCLYDQGKKRAALKGVADVVIPHLRKFWETAASAPGTRDESELSLAAFRGQTLLGWVINASTFKDPAFSEEKEWRVVILGRGKGGSAGGKKKPDMSVRFRSGPIGVTPFLQFPLRLSSSSSPLRRVVVGPTPHMQESVKAVEMILEDRGVTLRNKKHLDGVEVVPSRIPYRNW